MVFLEPPQGASNTHPPTKKKKGCGNPGVLLTLSVHLWCTLGVAGCRYGKYKMLREPAKWYGTPFPLSYK